MIFCDTSAVAKIYLPEKDSVAAQARFDTENEFLVSELARVELMAVFHRQLREGRWSRTRFAEVTHQFNSDETAGLLTWLPLDSEVINTAGRVYSSLPENVFLRASDCIHLVTALHHRISEVYTYDNHQSLAAKALGLTARVF